MSHPPGAQRWHGGRLGLALLGLLAAGLARAADPVPAAPPWALPPEGACAAAGAAAGAPAAAEAPPLPFAPGDAIGFAQIEALRDHLPPELWQQRERFFFEGMRLEIGPCFRDYGPPGFFQEATRRHAGQARLAEDGGLEGYQGGLPFPPETIPPDDPQAGLRWAWNVALRYQAAGFSGPFRIADVVGILHRAEYFDGQIFKVQTAFRADRVDGVQAGPGARDRHWVAGGLFFRPFAAREFAWRQYRSVAHLREPERSDDLHAYVPGLRRVQRVSAANVEGIYVPAFTTGSLPDAGSGSTSAGGAILGGPGGAGAAAATLPARRSAFEGLEIRPLLYSFEVLGVRDVLAPINAASPAYPEAPERSFGPWGVSFASDRWDLRRALVLRGTLRQAGSRGDVASVVHWVDLQTLQPLYEIAYDRRGEVLEVGQFVGRWSEDRPDYPPWPDDPGRPVRVIDPVGAAFADVRDDAGWRRESWTLVGTPPSDAELRAILSLNALTKRR